MSGFYINARMESLYKIALLHVNGVGHKVAARLLDQAGSAEGIFRMSRREILRIPGIGSLTADRILDKSILGRAEDELKYIRERGISSSFLDGESYPELLALCEDAPLVLFHRGSLDFDIRAGSSGGFTGVSTVGSPVRKFLSIVGTRRPSSYGLDLCRKLVRDLGERYPELVIVSGLAYGIDRCAHQSALENGLDTIAVLGHGFAYMYPAQHRQLARNIEAHGAVLTDFTSHEKPERSNFIKRNRIIAGLSQATVVVESGSRGGALLTADMAGSYFREVLAFPGRVSDPASKGCNHLIKTHGAAMIEDFSDLEYLLGWEPETGERHTDEPASGNGPAGNRSLSSEESEVLGILDPQSDMDGIHARTGIPIGILSQVLLDLELSGLVESLPGNRFRKVNR